MFQIENTLVTEDLFEKEFVCNLNACKGICCVEGDSGAPLLEEEKEILDRIFDKVKSYLSEEGIKAIEEQGRYVIDFQGELTTPLINGKECAYVVQDESGMYHCGIERAYNDGKIDWPKPISCHLYPVRVKDYSGFQAVNYDQWDICSAACELGKQLQVPLYKFLREPLIRRFGEEWYNDIEAVATQYYKEKDR
jgi:hypothetical protein